MLTPHLYLVPHTLAPVLDQHRAHRTPMLVALEKAAASIAADRPEAFVVLSARWTTGGPFRVDRGKRHRTLTDYEGFGVELRYDCDGDPALALALVEQGLRAGCRVAAATRGADSGVTVPMHFLSPARSIPVVPLSLPSQSALACRAWGRAIRSCLEAWPRRVTFIAGGMLSFNEHAWNLKRDVPEALAFDQATLDALARGAWDEIGSAARGVLNKARPEAGLRHLDVLRGAAGESSRGTVLGYEGAYGEGAALLEFETVPAIEESTASAEPPAAE
jgi:aromatic ring-opening dioxygenase catalytic subunit (LigB family)